MYDYTGKTIFLGLDVHKSTYSLTAICENCIIKREKISADPLLLVKYCKKYFYNARIKSAYEAGFSGYHLHRILISHGIENIVVHPANIEVSKNDSVKTDRRDSLKIATQLADNRLKGNFIPSVQREDKRHLTRLRECLVKQRTRTSCQIKSLLYSQGMISYDKVLRINKKTLLSVLRMKMPTNLQYKLKVLAQTWNYFSLQIAQTNEKMLISFTDDNWLKKVYCSIPGIGITMSNVLMNEIGDTLQFSNEQKLFSHAGLTPREHSSGDHQRQGHITKQGNPILRKMLIQAAWKAIKLDRSLLTVFERIRGLNKGKAKIAIVAVARVMLGRIRTCFKENRLYVNKSIEQTSVRDWKFKEKI